LPAGSGPSTCATVVNPWVRSGVCGGRDRFRWVGVVRGALLGPETTGPVPGLLPGWWGCCVWVPGVLPVVVGSFGGRRPPVCGVCGLLFENCIVDASIFRTGAAGCRSRLLLVGGCAGGWWCRVRD
jgi:hypothetical protein